MTSVVSHDAVGPWVVVSIPDFLPRGLMDEEIGIIPEYRTLRWI